MVEVLNVGNTIAALDEAFAQESTSVKDINYATYNVISKSLEINILGLSGNEKVSIFDIAGRQLTSKNTSVYKVNAGAYIVKINDYVTKVIVK